MPPLRGSDEFWCTDPGLTPGAIALRRFASEREQLNQRRFIADDDNQI